MLIDFYYNYLVAFDFGTDHTVYSSGGRNNYFDAVRDSLSNGRNINPQPSAKNIIAAYERYDTDWLADFLESNTGRRITDTGIRTTHINHLKSGMQYYSEVFNGVRYNHNNIFSDPVSMMKVTPDLINNIRGLHDNYT
jgi:hypothetical protein